MEFFEKTKGKYPWEVGGEYKLTELGDISVKFVGTFNSKNKVNNSVIFAGREFLQNLKGTRGEANQVFIKIDDPANIEKVVEELDGDGPYGIKTKFPFSTMTVDQKSFMTNAVQDLQTQIRVSHWIMLITIAVILIAVANTISMATRDRVQEIGILRSMGFRRVQISTLVLGESILLALAGGALGVCFVFAIRAIAESMGVNFTYAHLGFNINIDVTAGVLYTAAALSAAVGFFGGLLPAIAAGRLKIVNSLRNAD
jgi:ABC-type antimicrobial peptide transport system permease subunit